MDASQLGLVLACLVALVGCGADPLSAEPQEPYLLVLGTAQDAGLPQLGCRNECCEAARSDPGLRRLGASLLLVDPRDGRRWLFDASPDLREQVELARGHGSAGQFDGATTGRPPLFDGIFLSHAHMGHYAGLLHLGREAYGTQATPVYGTSRMCSFLENNGPWDLLISAKHLVPQRLEPGSSLDLAPDLRVSAISVPHRDEYSDTVAFRIDGPEHSALYLPDIDKWQRWEHSLEEVLASVDLAFVDATFFHADEIPGRAMSEVPHPFVVETMELLANAPEESKRKLRFLHLNHSNPVADPSSEEAAQVARSGFRVSKEGDLETL